MADLRDDPNIQKLIDDNNGVYTPPLPDDFVPEFVMSQPPTDMLGRAARVVIDVSDEGITQMWSSTHAARALQLLEQAAGIAQQVLLRAQLEDGEQS